MTIEQLRAAVAGAVSTPDDAAFAAASAFSFGASAADLIVRAASLDDVVAAVRHADESDLPVVVVSGGHSRWGTVPGGVLVDLRDLAGVEVDGTLVRVGGGARWGAVADALAPHGLALTSGDTRSVGVGGLTLGGGVGWMVRAWGLALDQLVGAQVVTAAGEVVETSAEAHPDLFWALRGGGGNFGVVTRFDFRAHRVGDVVHATAPIEGELPAVLRAWRDRMRHAPDELSCGFLAVPPMDPTAPAGSTLDAVWCGPDGDAARAAIADVFGIEGVGPVEVQVRPYAEILMDGPPEGVEMPEILDGNGLVRELSDEVIDAFCAAHAEAAGVAMVRYLRGGYGRVPSDATAWAHRDAEALLIYAAFVMPDTPAERRDALTASFADLDGRTLGAYGNFTNSVDGAMVRRMYPPATAARLREVKRAWDPRNRFARNHNIAP
jgi:FAD/FMN-containing dehydrogenase